MSNELEKTALNLGFIPLTDCAPLVIAKERGYFEKYGLEVQLSKETSWANIRDKVAIGILDGAQMLASMPLAVSLGVGPVHKPIVTAFSMDLNGNAITVSSQLYRRMLEADPEAMAERPVSARALKKVIDADRAAGRPPLNFAMVFPVSTHNYELRYWMAAAGIDPDNDVRLSVVPPPQMVTRLEGGSIDGYCVGEPWNELAVKEGLGHTLITSYEIWNNKPEKVFGVTEEWAEQYPNTHRAVIKALLEAVQWIDAQENRAEVARTIARGIYVNAPEHVVRMSMTGTFQYAAGEMPRALPDFNVFHRYAANFPWRSHALWLLSQMVRWGQIEQPVDLRAVAEAVYRPEIYRAAAAEFGLPVPREDYKFEGGHAAAWSLPTDRDAIAMGADRFFDGATFDPTDPMAYLAGFAIGHPAVELSAMQELNPRSAAPAVAGGGAV